MVQQAISNPLGINVFGSALIRVEPDIAALSFGVFSRDDKPAIALQATRNRAQQVQSYLNKTGIQEVSTTRISLQTHYEYGKFAGYNARVEFIVLLTDLTRVEEILVGTVDAGANSINNTTFQTSRLKELRAEARRRAVEAAREKAENYCKAAGVTLGDVLHIEDVNPDTLRGFEGHSMREEPAIDENEPLRAFSAGSIVVRGAVMMTYSIK
ncbi:MAG: SIMPL domain-containing protein [Chloroflexi bacterium]|nr:SIMPL domain-containing protein [Chloroflexota bacterium]